MCGAGIGHPRRYRIDFGTNQEGWSVARVELNRILQHVERGAWEPPTRADEWPATIDGKTSFM
jgi:hypothetical protein